MDVLLELAASLNSSLNVQLQNSQQYISAKNFISSTFNASLVVSLDPCIMPLDEVSFGLEVDLVAAFSNVATIIMVLLASLPSGFGLNPTNLLVSILNLEMTKIP